MIAQSLMAIKQIYPNFAKDDEEIEIKAKIWEKLLINYTDEQVSNALYICMQEMKYPPVPADLIERLKPNKAELWAELDKTLIQVYNLMDKFSYTAKEDDGISQGEHAKIKVQELWDNLCPELKAYIGSKGMMMSMALYDDKALQFERSAFMRAEIRPSTNAKLIENTENLKKIENN
jgi:hypothetical protein